MKKVTPWLACGAAILALILGCLSYFTPATASPEWIYTLEWINLILIPVIAAAFLVTLGTLFSFRSKNSRRFIVILGLCCCILFAIPFLAPDYQLTGWQWQYALSACWGAAFLLAGIWLFILATNAGPILAILLCTAGSLLLGLCVMELALLFSSQPGDGLTTLSANSRHANQTQGVPEYANWSDTVCGKKPAPQGGALPSFHRLAAFDKDLFDVSYSFNEQGWRRLPKASPDAENDLLIFGCSFTFGFGLEDEQTWAWQLAQDLGRNWQLDNYGANGYSANHMLCLLEHGLIQAPEGKNRYALFLGINHHFRRNEFFPNTPHYHLNGQGEAEAGGKARFNWIFSLPQTFNGSQLAREASLFIQNLAMKKPEKHIALYLAMLEKSARIFRNKYNTRLFVLIWPGLEEIVPELDKMGIPAILIRPMLTEWDTPEDPGWRYRIDRLHEPHPNQKAATQLASGLAQYFRDLSK